MNETEPLGKDTQTQVESLQSLAMHISMVNL